MSAERLQESLLAALANPEAALIEISRLDCEESLAEFVRQAWHIVEPGTKLKWNWHLDVICAYLEAYFDRRIKRLILNVPPGSMKSLLVSVFGPAWQWARDPSRRYINLTNEIGLATRDSLRMRQIVQSDWYQARWGTKVSIAADQREKMHFANTLMGFRQGLGITGNITGKRGTDLLIDDPLDAQKAFSDVEAQAVNDTYDNAVSSRLNDLDNDGILLIMQRLRTNDLTGHLLKKKKQKWVHVRIPMEFEPGEIGYDPVADLGPEYAHLADPRTKPGELMFPARFPRHVVESLKEDLGEYGCTPYESPILMADLTMKPIGEVSVGDQIVGFERRERSDGRPGRMRLTPATVLETHLYPNAPIVKMTLDSGEVIRCTADHKWFLSRASHDGDRSMYGPVRLGRNTKLARVCPPRLPELTPDDERLAGWLSGFYDGEGTVSLCRKTMAGEYRDSAQITIYQGAGRNLPLCEKLEHALRSFGFEYSYSEDDRKPNKDAPCYGYRSYRLTGNDLPLFQRFLHIVQPTKWRERIINGAFGAKFIKGRERVVKIEPDGCEDVYALTTTTGNYVVWGLASSNSAGQLQQRPNPLGGGIIKSSWWKKWPNDKPLPVCIHTFSSNDTAFSEQDHKKAAYSARTTWGIFEDDETGRHSLILLSAWWDRVGYPELRKLTREHHKKQNLDCTLIERKASGISLIQDMRRMRLSVRGFDPKKLDKIARAYIASPMFESGTVWYPDRKWADEVIDYVSQFPNGAAPSPDITDTVTQACIYVKRRMWAMPPDEDPPLEVEDRSSSEDEDDDRATKKKRGGAYG